GLCLGFDRRQFGAYLVELRGHCLGSLLRIGHGSPRLVGVLVCPVQLGPQLAGTVLDLVGLRFRTFGPGDSLGQFCPHAAQPAGDLLTFYLVLSPIPISRPTRRYPCPFAAFRFEKKTIV
ncbi:hypothetical protein, partial [Escherichia coli]|uniref:hypothetical protein n=1 Tax=Escherichia coli TaxID=562 RepID=UPI0013038645